MLCPILVLVEGTELPLYWTESEEGPYPAPWCLCARAATMLQVPRLYVNLQRKNINPGLWGPVSSLLSPSFSMSILPGAKRRGMDCSRDLPLLSDFGLSNDLMLQTCWSCGKDICLMEPQVILTVPSFQLENTNKWGGCVSCWHRDKKKSTCKIVYLLRLTSEHEVKYKSIIIYRSWAQIPTTGMRVWA